MENAATPTNNERNRRIANGRIPQIEPLGIPTHHFVIPGKPVSTDANVVRVTKLAVDSRVSRIQLQGLGNHHCGSLQLKTMVE